jgi:hypothetical protein
LPRGYSSRHQPTIVVPGASYDVALSSTDAEFSIVARFAGWRSPASTASIDVDGKAAERPHDFLRTPKNEVVLKEQMNKNELN